MCFTLQWAETLCIDLVIIFAIYAFIQLLLPLIAIPAPAGPIIVGIIRIICWAVIAIFIIYLIFGLLACLMSGTGFTLIPHR